jgi:hypothetical protein
MHLSTRIQSRIYGFWPQSPCSTPWTRGRALLRVSADVSIGFTLAFQMKSDGVSVIANRSINTHISVDEIVSTQPRNQSTGGITLHSLAT